MTDKLRLIGDVHGKYDAYLKIIEDADYSLQIGDFGFSYKSLDGVDPDRHKLIFGNHDNYDLFNKVPHNLGHFGEWDCIGVPIFYVRGGFSLDWKMRLPGKSWWPEEQMDYHQRKDCLDLWKSNPCSVVVSHECPLSVVEHITDGRVAIAWGYENPIIQTQTNTLLQDMLEYYTPDTWIHGHYHRHFDQVINGTRFICLPELGHIDFS